MLKQSTREKLQALILHPDFTGNISVDISDRKIIHKHCEPTLGVDVNIHADGRNVFDLLGELVPEMQVFNRRPYETNHETYICSGELSEGLIEESRVNIWAKHAEVPIEKTPAPTEVPGEIIQSNYTTESEVVANA